MKKITYCILFVLVLLVSCKKNCPNPIPNLTGTNWVGKWGDDFTTPNNNYSMNLTTSSTGTINNGFASYNLQWKIENFTFIGTYSISGNTLELRAPVDNIKLSGTWANTTTNMYHGTFYMSKQ